MFLFGSGLGRDQRARVLLGPVGADELERGRGQGPRAERLLGGNRHTD